MTNNERFPGNNIHDTAIISDYVHIGTGNTIGPYCLIGLPAEWKGHEFDIKVTYIGNDNRLTGLVTVDAGVMIYDRCYLMKHSHIGHDAIIGNDCTLSCGAKIGGHTKIREGCNIGLNAVIHQKQDIAPGCMIGMGAVVTKTLVTEPHSKYAGNPARYLKPNK